MTSGVWLSTDVKIHAVLLRIQIGEHIPQLCMGLAQWQAAAESRWQRVRCPATVLTLVFPSHQIALAKGDKMSTLKLEANCVSG